MGCAGARGYGWQGLRRRGRVLRALRRLASRRGCATLAELAAETRLAPSEVEEALTELEERRLVVVSGSRVCYTGGGWEEAETGRELRRVLEALASRRSIIASVRRAVLGPFHVVIASRRDGIVYVILPVEGREPPERLVAWARRLARLLRREAEEGCQDLPGIGVEPRLLVPVLASDYGAPRIIEGVAYRPAAKLLELAAEPETLLSDPMARFYECRRRARRGESQYIA